MTTTTDRRERDARTLEVFELHAPRVLATPSRWSHTGERSARQMLAALKRLRASVAA